jgi:hypothetical protein
MIAAACAGTAKAITQTVETTATFTAEMARVLRFIDAPERNMSRTAHLGGRYNRKPPARKKLVSIPTSSRDVLGDITSGNQTTYRNADADRSIPAVDREEKRSLRHDRLFSAGDRIGA